MLPRCFSYRIYDNRYLKYLNLELALLNNKPRAVNIRAKGRLKVATLGKKAFVRLLGPVVDILKRNSDNYETITRS